MVKCCSHPAYGHPWDSCTLCLSLQDWCKVKPAKYKQSKKNNLSNNNRSHVSHFEWQISMVHGTGFPNGGGRIWQPLEDVLKRTASSLAPRLVGVLGCHGPSQREKTLCSVPVLCQSSECWFRHNERRHRCWSQALPVYDRRRSRTPSSPAGADAGRYSDLPTIC